MKTAALLIIVAMTSTGCATMATAPAPHSARITPPPVYGHIVAVEYDGVWYPTEGSTLDVNCTKDKPCRP